VLYIHHLTKTMIHGKRCIRGEDEGVVIEGLGATCCNKA
jgi:hypothetical protein